MIENFSARDLEDLEGFEIDDEFLGHASPELSTRSETRGVVESVALANPVADMVAKAEAALGLSVTNAERQRPETLSHWSAPTAGDEQPGMESISQAHSPEQMANKEMGLASALTFEVEEVLAADEALEVEIVEAQAFLTDSFGLQDKMDPFTVLSTPSDVLADTTPPPAWAQDSMAEVMLAAEARAEAEVQALSQALDGGVASVETKVALGDEASVDQVSDSLPIANVSEVLPTLSGGGSEVQIPRITVHVFAERQDTLGAAERAGQDRRMSRATTQIRVGGIPAAIQAYQYENTPPLIIVENMQDARSLLNQIDELAEVCDAGTKVIIIGATNDIQLYRELMRRGVSEYLVAPVQPLQLISAIDSLFSDPAQPFVGRSIAFVGARGGSGASSVAHNTAYAMSERIGINTVIVDYDLPFGTAGLDFNQDPLSGVADALSQPDRLDATLLDRMMARCTDKLSLFAAPATLDGDWDIRPEAFEEVTSRIRSTAPFVVLDLPHLWSGWMRKTLISADEVVVVATPDLASLRNAKNMIDLIKQARPNDAPPRLVLNQVGMPGRPEIPAKDFGAALGIHPSLSIPFDAKTFGAAANNGQMILDAAAKSRSAEAFETLAQIVSCRELPAGTTKGVAPSKSKSSLLASLFNKKP